MEIQEMFNLLIVSAGLSYLLELLTSNLDEKWSKITTIVMSIIVAGLFVWVRNTEFFPTVLTVLGFASAVYAFLIKK